MFLIYLETLFGHLGVTSPALYHPWNTLVAWNLGSWVTKLGCNEKLQISHHVLGYIRIYIIYIYIYEL